MNNLQMNLEYGLNEFYFNYNGIDVFYKLDLKSDTDNIIVFLHGLACSHDSFISLFDGNYFPDYSLLLIDLPGFGKSSKPESFSNSMEDTARVIEALINNIPCNTVHIAAHSMSGAAALLFSEPFYKKVKSFVNIEGNLISDDCGILSRGIISTEFHEFKYEKYPKLLIEFDGHPQLHFHQTTPEAVFKSALSLVNWSDSGELLKKFISLNCLKSYFYGEENSSMPVLKLLGNIETYMIKNSGHGMMTDNPVEFYTTLSKVIKKQP